MALLQNTSNCGCACVGIAGNVFSATAGKQSRHASQHVRDVHAVMHAGIANSRFPLIGGGEKRSRHSRRMRNPQFYVSGKRPVAFYRQTSNIKRTLVGDEIVDHSDVVRASPVGAAPTTSSLSTSHMASVNWAKRTARQDEKHWSFGIWCDLY